MTGALKRRRAARVPDDRRDRACAGRQHHVHDRGRRIGRSGRCEARWPPCSPGAPKARTVSAPRTMEVCE